MVRKGFGPRLGAALIDAVIMIVVAGVLGLVFGIGFSVRFGNMGGPSGVLTAEQIHALRVGGIIGALVGLAYSSMEIFMAATPGKMALKMRITRQDGSVADQATLIKRWAIKHSPDIVNLLAAITLIGLLNTIGGLLGLIIVVSCFMTLRASKLALHDDWAGTAVYGPGVEQAAFPVMPVGAGTTASAPGSVPPPPPAV